MDKVAIITGAAGGLGGVLAEALSGNGYRLGLVVRPNTSAEKLRQLESLCQPKRSLIFKCDLTSSDDLSALSKNIQESFDGVNVLLNVAAIQGAIGPAINNKLSDWKKTFSVNLDAPMYLIAQIVPLMISVGGGSIINFSGGGATGVRKNFSAYAASKTALVRYSEIIAAELAENNISVNCISPGILPTNMLHEIIDQAGLAGQGEVDIANKNLLHLDSNAFDRVINLVNFLTSPLGAKISGKLLSAVWDNWELFPEHESEILGTEIFTLKRITGRDINMNWADK